MTSAPQTASLAAHSSPTSILIAEHVEEADGYIAQHDIETIDIELGAEHTTDALATALEEHGYLAGPVFEDHGQGGFVVTVTRG